MKTLSSWFVRFSIIGLVIVLSAQNIDAGVPSCTNALKYWGSYQELHACLRSAPSVAWKKKKTLESLQLAIENYAFVDIIKAPPNPQFTPPVDLIHNLKHVEATDYDVDADLQQAYADAFVPLHDAHTRYNKPAPYSASFFVLPFKFDSIVDALSGEQQLRLRYSTAEMDIYESIYGEKVVPEGVDINGWVISSIDEKPSMDVVQSLDVGVSKDAGSRLNLALNGYGDDKGYFGWRGIGRFAIPSQEIVTLTLVPSNKVSLTSSNCVTISVKWLGMYQSASMEVESTVKTLLASPEFKHDPDEQRARIRAHELYQAKLYSLTVGKPFLSKIETISSIPVADSSGVAYADYGQGVGILKISTFSPGDYDLFRARVIEAMHNFTLSPAKNTKLIIDLRANGGGSICLGYAVSRYLFPSLAQLTEGQGPHALARYDMKKSALLASFASTAAKNVQTKPGEQTCGDSPGEENFFSPCAWFGAAASDREASLITSVMLSDGSWMEEQAVLRTRGGVTSEYSMLVHEGCDGEYDAWAPPGAGFDGLAPENVILLSDGLCGSTCAVFASSLQLTGFAKTVVVGGYSDQPQQFFSFPGGQVVTIEFLAAMAAELKLMQDPNLPAILPDGATFRFALREIYPWNSPHSSNNPNDLIPLEFVHVPADYHLNYDAPYLDSEAVIRRVVALFDGTCPPLAFVVSNSQSKSSCAVCPPSSTVNARRDGCYCHYGWWDANTLSCSWNSRPDESSSLHHSTEGITTNIAPVQKAAQEYWSTASVLVTSVVAFVVGVSGTVYARSFDIRK